MSLKRRLLACTGTVLAACTGLALSTPALAIDNPEVEGNSTKATANAFTLNNGDSVSGQTTGSSTTTTTLGSADYFRIKTSAQPLGIYRHQLALTATGTAGHAVTIRGLSQSSNVISTTSDVTFQTGSTTTSPARAVYWYGFGKQEEIYYRVTGGSTTTGTYTATLTDTVVTPTTLSGTLYAGNFTFKINSVSGSADTEMWLYDSNYNALQNNVPASSGPAGADDALSGGGLSSFARNNLPAGTYTMAIGLYNFANNQPSLAPDWGSGNVLDFANAVASSIVNNSSAYTVNLAVSDSSGNTQTSSDLSIPVGANGLVHFVQFTVTNAPVPTGVGTATPNPVGAGSGTTLSIAVTPAPGSNLGNITQVKANISALTGNVGDTAVVFTPDGMGNWTYAATAGASTGSKSVAYTITDSGCSCDGTGSFSVSVVPPPPANDTCSTAIALSLGVPADSDNTNALTNDGLAPSCQANVAKGIWYTYTAASDAIFTYSGCGTGFDSVLTLYTITDCSNTATWTQVGCDDDSCAGGEPGPGGATSGAGTAPVITNVLQFNGQKIYARLQSYSSNFGQTRVTVTSTGAAGACCNNNTGACSITASGNCTGSTVTWNTGQSCGVPPCAQTGACCNDTTGACSTTTSAGCLTGSTWNSAQTCGVPPCLASGSCCSAGPVYACSVTTQTACPSGSTWNTGGTCSPNLCAPVPSNDLCTNAIPLYVNTLEIGNNASATGDATEGPAPSCQANSKLAVWYTFTAPATAAYKISACGSLQDSILTVLSGADCGSLTQLTGGCNDDDCAGGEAGPGGGSGSTLASVINSLTLTAGTTYRVRLSTYSSTSTEGVYQLLITYVNSANVGSCCIGTNACILADSAANCPSGTYVAATTCTPDPCNRACCFPNGDCTFVSNTACMTASGTPGGVGTSCTPNMCMVPQEACCTSTGDCTLAAAATCTSNGGTPGGLGSVCEPNTCPQPERCCFANGTCTKVLGGTCITNGGTPSGAGVCDPNTCPQPVACCFADGTCTFGLTCNGGVAGGLGSVCEPNSCPQPVACCKADGSCTFGLPAACTDGTPGANGSTCTPNTCPQPVACCFADGNCTFVLAASCTGTPGASGSSCTPNDCPQPVTGTCCRGTTCNTSVAEASCTAPGAGIGAVYAAGPLGNNCNVTNNRAAPCCYPDFNKTAGVTVQDIFDYLAAWFAGSPYARYAGDGTGGAPTAQSIFDFLAAWFAGPCPAYP